MSRKYIQALEGALEKYRADENETNYKQLLTVLVQGITKEEEVISAGSFKSEDGNDELHFNTLNAEDGNQFFVMYTSKERLEAFPCPLTMQTSLFQLILATANQQDLAGVIVNPGTDSLLLTIDEAKGLLGYAYAEAKKGNKN